MSQTQSEPCPGCDGTGGYVPATVIAGEVIGPSVCAMCNGSGVAPTPAESGGRELPDAILARLDRFAATKELTAFTDLEVRDLLAAYRRLRSSASAATQPAQAEAERLREEDDYIAWPAPVTKCLGVVVNEAEVARLRECEIVLRQQLANTKRHNAGLIENLSKFKAGDEPWSAVWKRLSSMQTELIAAETALAQSREREAALRELVATWRGQADWQLKHYPGDGLATAKRQCADELAQLLAQPAEQEAKQ